MKDRVQVNVGGRFAQALGKLPADDQKSIALAMKQLVDSPDPTLAPGVVPVKGSRDVRSLPVSTRSGRLLIYFSAEADSTAVDDRFAGHIYLNDIIRG